MFKLTTRKRVTLDGNACRRIFLSGRRMYKLSADREEPSSFKKSKST